VLKFIGMDGGCEFFKRQNRTDSPLPTCLDEQAKRNNPFFDTFVAAMNSVKVVNGPPPYNQIQLRFKEMEEAVLMGKETSEAGVKKAAEDCRQSSGRSEPGSSGQRETSAVEIMGRITSTRSARALRVDAQWTLSHTGFGGRNEWSVVDPLTTKAPFRTLGGDS